MAHGLLVVHKAYQRYGIDFAIAMFRPSHCGTYARSMLKLKLSLAGTYVAYISAGYTFDTVYKFNTSHIDTSYSGYIAYKLQDVLC